MDLPAIANLVLHPLCVIGHPLHLVRIQIILDTCLLVQHKQAGIAAVALRDEVLELGDRWRILGAMVLPGLPLLLLPPLLLLLLLLSLLLLLPLLLLLMLLPLACTITFLKGRFAVSQALCDMRICLTHAWAVPVISCTFFLTGIAGSAAAVAGSPATAGMGITWPTKADLIDAASLPAACDPVEAVATSICTPGAVAPSPRMPASKRWSKVSRRWAGSSSACERSTSSRSKKLVSS